VGYEYKLVAIDYQNRSEMYGPIDVMPRMLLPQQFALQRNFPNPFNHHTTIRFELPIRTPVALNVYSLLGHLIRQLISPEKPLNP